MPSIRQYRPGDKNALEHVCIETANRFLRSTRFSREATLEVYNRYYTELAPEHIFVAADDSDAAVGYIICAPDFDSWSGEFLSRYVKKSFNPLTRIMGKSSVRELGPHKDGYPAHLHIDILDEYQRIGLGTQLMDALTAHLRKLSVPGVALGVDPKNEKGVSFYKKYGFSVLSDDENGFVMGLKLL